MQKSFATQPKLFVSAIDLNHPAICVLDSTEEVLDWAAIESILSPIYASQTGRPSYPLLSLFRGLLLGVWYGLSDVQLSNNLYRDLVFRKFCHFELGDDVPEASTLGRFRNQLVQHDLWERILGEVNDQLERKRIILAEARINIIDATPVEAARSSSKKDKDEKPTRDEDGGWHVKKNSRGKLRSTFGFSVHSGVDEDGFVHRQTMTPGNVHDSQQRDALVLGNEVALYADSAYHSKETSDNLKQNGIKDCVQHQSRRGKPLSEEDRIRNREISVTRSGVERLFAIYKSRYGLGRTRFMGLIKNMTVYGLAAIAHNIRKAAKFLALYGLANPGYAG